jgi:dihydroflavonol-4-reductase
MTTLVTGGVGFIGRHLVSALLREGKSVRVLDRDAPYPNFPTEVKVLQGCITDPDDLEKAVEGVETVFHLAANAHLWARDPSIFELVNHQGTRLLLLAAREARVKRFIHVSSLTTLIGKSMTGSVRTVTEETQVPESDMTGPYPLSKWRAEQKALSASSPDFSVSVALPTIPMGPGDRNLTAPTRMLLDLLNGKIPAYLECEQNIVHVEDVAKGLILTRDHGQPSTRYILGGENLTMGEMTALLGGLTRLSMPKARVPYALALTAGYVQECVANYVTGKRPQAPLTGVRLARCPVRFDITKAREELGYAPRAAEHALHDAAAWLQSEGLAKQDFELPEEIA